MLTNLGRRLETVVPPDQVLQTLVHEVGTTLKLGHVAATHGDVIGHLARGSGPADRTGPRSSPSGGRTRTSAP